MQRICSWCGKYMGEKNEEEEGITHTICPECEEKMLQDDHAVLQPLTRYTEDHRNKRK